VRSVRSFFFWAADCLPDSYTAAILTIYEFLNKLNILVQREIYSVFKTIRLCLYFVLSCFIYRSRGSSGSIVSDYGLEERGSIPGGGKGFFSSSLCVQTGSGDHTASCTMGTGGPFPRGKARSGRDSDLSPLSSAEV
jgi:hypothetical protein